MKGDNLLLDGDGNVKIADFGAAKLISDGANTGTQTVLGTPYFMAPELISLCRGGAAADIWALGITAAELLNCGKLPWPPFGAPYAAFAYIGSHDPTLAEFFSADAVDFIRKCTTRDPAARPTAHELLTHPWLASL